MALNGELEDLALVDIVQMVGLSRLSGHLRIERKAAQQAAIGFRDGRIVFAHTSESGAVGPPDLPTAPREREAFVRRRIQTALRVLLRLGTGRFEFTLGEPLALGVRPPGFERETLDEGLDPQGTLIDLLREMDEEARDGANPPARPRTDLGDGEMMAEFKRRLAGLLGQDDDARYDLGIAYMSMGLVEDAIRELEVAARAPRHALRCASLLGRCHLVRGDAREAVRWLERGLALPDGSEAGRQGLRLLLSLAYAAVGRIEAALRLQEQFVREGVWLAGRSRPAAGDHGLCGPAHVLPFPRTGTRG